MGEYIERKPMPGELFSKLKLKCPVNTKALCQSCHQAMKYPL